MYYCTNVRALRSSDVSAIPKLIKPSQTSIIVPHLRRAPPLRISPRANFNRHRSGGPVIARAIRIGGGIPVRANESLNLRPYARFRIGQINGLHDTLRPSLHIIS